MALQIDGGLSSTCCATGVASAIESGMSGAPFTLRCNMLHHQHPKRHRKLSPQPCHPFCTKEPPPVRP